MEACSMLDEAILNILVCPLTRSKLQREGDFLVAQTGGLKYPIVDGIPVLVAEQAVLPAGIQSLAEFKEQFKPQIP